jgi:GT2 family glycosyltransferase
MSMHLSLILCTRNRASQLARCLASMAAIRSTQPWELVVVDNGSTDDTRAVIEAARSSIAAPLVYAHQPVQGLSSARNAGVAASQGSLILFTDDDCYPAPDLLDAACAAFSDPAVGFVTGRILLYDPDDFPTTINESMQPARFAPHRFIPAGAVKGANFGFRRLVLDQIGPFDPAFGAGSHFPAEDADAVMRASLAGWAGVYAPAMQVSHHHGRKASEARKLYRSYDYGRGAFHAKLACQPGGFGMGVKAMLSLPWRMRHRPSMGWWELRGMIDYWRLRS